MSARERAAEVRPGKPQGGAKSEAGRAAYWRMQWESAIGALADLIAEHTETVEAADAAEARLARVEALVDEWERESPAWRVAGPAAELRAALKGDA